MNYTSNMGMNMPDENDKFSIEHFNTNTQALDIVGKPDEYKNTKTYAVGDLCIHNNILYKCIIAVETAEEFNAEKWEVTSLCKEEIANKTAIAELNENLGKNTFGDKVTLVKDQNYICPSDGYFHVVCGYQEKSRAVGFINDINLVALSSTNSSSVVINNSMASIIFVRAGMTIKYTGTNAQGYFIPLI